jgi:hypothetical protein
MDKREIHFLVREAPEGGYVASAVGHTIVTEANTVADLHQQVREAARCHFEPENSPAVIHLHFTREEIIAA